MRQLLSLVLVIQFLSACSSSDGHELCTGYGAVSFEKQPSICGVEIGMDSSELDALGYHVEYSNEVYEGEAYKIATVETSPGISLFVTFFNNVVSRVETADSSLRDANGLGVGSRLFELEEAYPTGRFIYGDEGRLFVNYIVDETYLLKFDPSDLARSCFQPAERCKIESRLSVVKIQISDGTK